MKTPVLWLREKKKDNQNYSPHWLWSAGSSHSSYKLGSWERHCYRRGDAGLIAAWMIWTPSHTTMGWEAPSVRSVCGALPVPWNSSPHSSAPPPLWAPHLSRSHPFYRSPSALFLPCYKSLFSWTTLGKNSKCIYSNLIVFPSLAL